MSEYRVVWQREGLSRKTAIRQTLAGAERLALTLQGRIEEATGDSAEAYACCDGYDCSCAGETNAEVWARMARNVPPLVVGPVIESREVGPWEALEVGPTQDPAEFAKLPDPCMSCGSVAWTYRDYGGCDDCRDEYRPHVGPIGAEQ